MSGVGPLGHGNLDVPSRNFPFTVSAFLNYGNAWLKRCNLPASVIYLRWEPFKLGWFTREKEFFGKYFANWLKRRMVLEDEFWWSGLQKWQVLKPEALYHFFLSCSHLFLSCFLNCSFFVLLIFILNKPEFMNRFYKVFNSKTSFRALTKYLFNLETILMWESEFPDIRQVIRVSVGP